MKYFHREKKPRIGKRSKRKKPRADKSGISNLLLGVGVSLLFKDIITALAGKVEFEITEVADPEPKTEDAEFEIVEPKKLPNE